MIRRYTMRDIPILLDHIGIFLSETETYKDMKFEPEKLRAMLMNNLNNTRFFCNLAIDASGDVIIGGLCGMLYEYTFSKQQYAADLLFYIPRDRRSLATATELVESYVEWAKKRGALECRLANSTGVRPESYAKLCQRLNFTYLGPIYQMRF